MWEIIGSLEAKCAYLLRLKFQINNYRFSGWVKLDVVSIQKIPVTVNFPAHRIFFKGDFGADEL